MDDQKGRKLPKTGPAAKTELDDIIIITKGTRDMVFLRHNHMKVFVLNCPQGKPSHFRIAKKFYTHEEREWDAVFMAYLRWKRKQSPEFKLTRYSGQKRSGEHHPWRWHRKIHKEHEP